MIYAGDAKGAAIAHEKFAGGAKRKDEGKWVTLGGLRGLDGVRRGVGDK